MLNKSYKLQDTLDVYITSLDNGKLLITFQRMTTRERVEIIANEQIAKFLSSLNGKKTAKEILQELGNFEKEQAIKLLIFLEKQHFIYENKKVSINNRFSRQIAYFDDMILNQLGTKSQEILQKKHILVIGCGAVTGAMIEILARSGVENFTIIDDRKVRTSDLSRHLFIREKDIGKYKVDVISNYLKRINKDIQVNILYQRMHPETNLTQWIDHSVDLVINGCDEPYIGHTSLKLGRFLAKLNIPMYVMGGFDAHLMSSGELIYPPKTPCIDCCQKTFQSALKDWKPKYNNITTKSSSVLISNFQNSLNSIGGAGGILPMTLFSANISCIRIIHFLTNDVSFDYITKRYEYLPNDGKITNFEMSKQKNCEICNG